MNKEKLLELSDTLRGIAEGKEWEYKGIDWFRPIHDITYYLKLNIPIRLKPQPDPYAELKAAHAAGKTIQIVYFDQVNGFTRINVEPDWSLPASSYRIKPEPQKLPLSQDDVKAGDEFLAPDGNRFQWGQLAFGEISLDDQVLRFITLMENGWKIRSIGETEWRDCYKLVKQ